MYTIKEKLDQFNELLLSRTYQALEHDSLAETIVEMNRALPEITAKAIEIGDETALDCSSLSKVSDENVDAYIVHHRWVDEVKEFAVLWRNSALEISKASQFLDEGRIEHIQAVKLMDQTKAVVKEAQESITNLYTQLKQDINPKKDNRLIYDAAKQIDAWPIYKEQLKELTEHTRKVANAHSQLQRSDATYNTIRRILSNYTQKRKEIMSELSDYADKAQSATATISVDSDQERYNEVISKIDEVQDQLNLLNIEHSHQEQIEKILSEIDQEIDIPVSYDGAQLYSKQIELGKDSQQWLRTELMFKYVQLEEIENQVKNNLKMTLLNLKNKLLMMRNKVAEPKPKVLMAQLSAFEESYAPAKSKHATLLSRAQNVLDSNFYLSEIYNDQYEFLPLTRQSTFDSIEVGSSKVKDRVSDWAVDNFSFVGELLRDADKEKLLSNQEKAIRYVESRKLQNLDNQYSSVFLVKGYIGDSFVVGREAELERLSEIYAKWEQGYPGAILVTGQRYAGKSLFLEYANIKKLGSQAVNLVPNQEYKIAGKSYQAGYDLEEVLSEIAKYAINRPKIIIDDIEKWQNEKYPLAYNLRVLCQFIDRYNSQIFFAVSMSNWLRNKMEQMLHLSKVFVAEINLDNMSLAEIRQVITVRQNATYRKLQDSEGKDLEPETYDSITKNIYKASRGNVGDALFRWLLQIDTTAQAVRLQSRDIYELPEVDDPQILLLLEYILMHRKTNEALLQKHFGEAYENTYYTRLQRLISMGIVTKDIDGMIQISTLAVNDIGRLLQRNAYIKYEVND